MYCIDLIKEENGSLFICDCKLGDMPSLFYENISNYSVSHHDDKKGHIYSTIDVDTMLIANPLGNADIDYVDIACEYKPCIGIRELYLYMNSMMDYPFNTQAEFEEFFKKLADSGRFNVVMPELHSKWNFKMICFENKKCEVDFTFSKVDNINKNYFVKIIARPPIWREDNIFDTEAAIFKKERRLALKLGKRMVDLSEKEKKEAWVSVANDTLVFYEKVWGNKIDKSLMEYRRDNLIGPGQMRTSDWDQIYKNAGMNTKEIEQLRKANEPYAAALNDSSDMYRD